MSSHKTFPNQLGCKELPSPVSWHPLPHWKYSLMPHGVSLHLMCAYFSSFATLQPVLSFLLWRFPQH